MAEHTSGPWRVNGHSIEGGERFRVLVAGVEDADGQELANAQFIVTACNANHELLAALKTFLAQWEQVEPAINAAFVMQHIHGGNYTGPQLDIQALRDVVAKTEGVTHAAS